MYIFLVLSFSSGYCIVQIYKATANRVGPSNEKSYEKTSTTEVHSGTYVLTEFCKASADTFRVFQELVSTFVDAAFLKSNDIISHSIHLSVMSTKRTSLPVRDLVVKSLAQSSKQRWTRLLYSRRKSFIYHSCQYRNLQVQPSN